MFEFKLKDGLVLLRIRKPCSRVNTPILIHDVVNILCELVVHVSWN